MVASRVVVVRGADAHLPASVLAELKVRRVRASAGTVAKKRVTKPKAASKPRPKSVVIAVASKPKPAAAAKPKLKPKPKKAPVKTKAKATKPASTRGLRKTAPKTAPKRQSKPEIFEDLADEKPKRKRAAPKSKPPKSPWHIYVLELEGGRVYVGKSKNVQRRLDQHKSGGGAAFTKLYHPTGRMLPRLGTLDGEGDGPERDETLRQMESRGFDSVRGWRYCRATLTAADKRDIEANLREMFDLCRRCGRAGHFATSCKHGADRHGNPLR